MAQKQLDKAELRSLGLARAGPVVEGVATDLRSIAIDSRETINVGQRAYAYGSPEIRRSRYLITENLISCVAVLAYNSSNRVGFLTHLDTDFSLENPIAAMQKIMEIGANEILVYGGDRSTINVAFVEGFLMTEGSGIRVVGRDLLRGPFDRSSRIGMDTATGAFFIPDTKAKVEPEGIRIGNGPLLYAGWAAAPEKIFLEIARR